MSPEILMQKNGIVLVFWVCGRSVPYILPFHLKGVDIVALLFPLFPIDGFVIKEGP